MAEVEVMSSPVSRCAEERGVRVQAAAYVKVSAKERSSGSGLTATRSAAEVLHRLDEATVVPEDVPTPQLTIISNG
jgi:hypothetical protein